MLGVAKVDQGIEALARLEHDVAALAAVAAVGPAIFAILLEAEADRARPAGTGADEDLGMVEEIPHRHIEGRAGKSTAPARLRITDVRGKPRHARSCRPPFHRLHLCREMTARQ